MKKKIDKLVETDRECLVIWIASCYNRYIVEPWVFRATTAEMSEHWNHGNQTVEGCKCIYGCNELFFFMCNVGAGSEMFLLYRIMLNKWFSDVVQR